MSRQQPLLDNFHEFLDAFNVATDHERIGSDKPLKFRLDDITSFNFLEVTYGDYAETEVLAWGERIWGGWWLLEAWCDTTGWDCQAGGTIRTASMFDDLVRYGMSRETRSKSGLLLPEEQ